MIKEQERIFDGKFSHVYYYYPSMLTICPIQPSFSTPEISVVPGFPTIKELNELENGSLCIIDDQRIDRI